MVDLRKAKPGDIYVDGFGRKVRILCNDRKDRCNIYNVIALMETDCDEEIRTYTLDGEWVYGQQSRYGSDLVKRINEFNNE